MRAAVLILIFSGVVSMKQCTLNKDFVKTPNFEKSSIIENCENSEIISKPDTESGNILFTPYFFRIRENKNTGDTELINYS